MVRSHVLGTIRRGWEPDRSRCSGSASSVQWKSRLRYGSAILWRQRKTCMASRNLMRSGTRSHYRSRSRCETWYNRTSARWKQVAPLHSAQTAGDPSGAVECLPASRNCSPIVSRSMLWPVTVTADWLTDECCIDGEARQSNWRLFSWRGCAWTCRCQHRCRDYARFWLLLPMQSGMSGKLSCWRGDAHQSTSFLLQFSWSRFARIHSDTLSMQTDILCCVCVGHVHEPCKTGWTDRDAIGGGLHMLKEPCVR